MIKERSLFTPFSLALFSGVSLLPVYVFSSGGVQPAHFLLAIFAGSMLLRRGYKIETWSLLMLSFAIFVLIVELIYGVDHGGDARGILNAIFLIFNFLVAQAISRYVESTGLKPIYFGVLLAASIGVLSVVSTGVNLSDISGTGRATGTFNNPNQLGFFSVCLLSMTYFLYAAKRVPYHIAVALFFAAIFLSILSLSKAAILANGMVLFLALKPRLTATTLLLWLLGVFAAVFIIFSLYQKGAFDEYLFIQRLQGIATEDDSSLAARGYFAIANAEWYQILWGLGSRNVTLIIGHEVHSTFGSTLNNYGVIGLVFLVTIFWIWVRNTYRHFGLVGVVSIIGPSLLYGITHNGIRFALFWVLFATTIGYMNRMTELLGNNSTSSDRETLSEARS